MGTQQSTAQHRGFSQEFLYISKYIIMTTRVFFDVAADGTPIGKIIMELRTDVSQRHVRISVLFALERRASDLRDPLSIVSSPTSCVREEISLLETALVESQSTETSSKTRTSP